MRKTVAVVSALALAGILSGCSSSAGSLSGTAASEDAASHKAISDSVASLDDLVKRIHAKDYPCQEVKKIKETGVKEAGTCSGEDKLMVFDDVNQVEQKARELRLSGVSHVYGENWIVANTKTPTMVRNALGGIRVEVTA